MWRKWTIFATLMLGGASMGLVFALSPILSALSARLGGGKEGDFAAQMLLVVPSLGFMAGGWISGFLLDRLGLGRLASLSIAAYGLMGGAGLFVDDVWILLVSRLLVGFASACLITTCIALTAETYEPELRSRLIGFEVAAGGIASIAGIFFAGIAAARFGWRAPFAFYLAFGGIGLLMVLASFPSQLLAARESAARVASGTLRSVWSIYAMAIPLSMLSVMGVTQLPFLLTADGIRTLSLQSTIISMAAIFTIVGSSFYGTVQSYAGRPNTFLGGLIFATAGLLIIGFSHAPFGIGAGSGLLGLGAGIFSPYVRDVTVIRAPSELRSRAIGRLSTSTSFGNFIGPFVIVPLQATFGLHGAFLAVGVFLTVATATAAGMRLAR